jgi:hypothetical protein
MFNEFFEIRLTFKGVSIWSINQRIFGEVQNYRDKPIYIKLSGSNEK